MHSQHGIPQLYHDQLNVIGEHLWHLKHDPEFLEDAEEFLPLLEVLRTDPHLVSKEEQTRLFKALKFSEEERAEFSNLFRVYSVKKQRKLTRELLKRREDWIDWETSEDKQLQQYFDQDTFGEPQGRPPGTNLLSLLWVYLVKDDGRKKARCVCNGSKNCRGTVTLAETYASSLEQNAARLFWASTALNNWITIGADAANAFAGAKAPVAPLYIYCDEQFRSWYHRKLPDRPEVRKGMLLDQIGIPQEAATVLYEDNQGALLMANAQKPTKRTRHMDIKAFGIQDWVQRDLLSLQRINTADNYADAMTKALGRTLFYRHVNYIMGKIVPTYAYRKDLIFRFLYDKALSSLSFNKSLSREGDKWGSYPIRI